MLRKEMKLLLGLEQSNDTAVFSKETLRKAAMESMVLHSEQGKAKSSESYKLDPSKMKTVKFDEVQIDFQLLPKPQPNEL